MNSGSRQDQRLPPALRAGFVLPDEIGLAQRVRATLKFASNLAFSNPQGTMQGHWGEALETDESVILADIAAYPVEAQRDLFFGALDQTTPADLMRGLWALVGRVERWYRLLQPVETPDGQALGLALSAEIEGRLGPSLRLCLQHYGQSLTGAPGQVSPATLSAAWGLDSLTDPANASRGTGPVPGLDSSRRDTLRNAGLSFFQAIGALKTAAQQRLPSSLLSGKHEPALSLLLAFLQLHEQAQGPLNRFPERLTDFYYQDILGMRPRAAALEKAHLLLDVEPTYKGNVHIEKGTRFVGGRDAKGSAVEFVADQSSDISSANVAALCTLNLERDALISPERELGFASQAKAQTLPLAASKAAGAPKPEWNPLFGASSGVSHAPDARLGFAVSSPLFELREGQRELTVALHLSRPSDRDSSLGELLKLSAAEREACRPPWLSQVFERYAALDEGGVSKKDDAAGLAQKTAAPSAGDGGDQYLRFLVARCLSQQEPADLCERLGMLFTVWLTTPSDDLQPGDRKVLQAHVLQVLKEFDPTVLEADDPLTLVFSDQPAERALLFDQVFRGLWKAKLSTATGWLGVDEVFCRLRNPAELNPGEGGCVELLMRLGPEQPALSPCTAAVHGAQWPVQTTLRLELQNQTRIFGYTLLSRLEWRELELAVSVRGLRDVLVYNQMGQLDPGKPFQPFGPLPEEGSYFVLGSAEMAPKPLLGGRVRLTWGGLPREQGGFEQHYESYPGVWTMDAFQTRPSLLRDGQWQTAASTLPLFQNVPGRLQATAACSLGLDVLDLRRNYRCASMGGEGLPFDYSSRARNGFFRFELAGPADAFGHSLYTRLLTETLTRNARLKGKDPNPLPAAPYTPVVQSLELDYQAGLSLYAGQDAGSFADQTGAPPAQSKVFHLHPFGNKELGRDERTFLIPPFPHDGNLCIGLQARAPGGPLSLFFHLCPEAAGQARGEARPIIHWAVWRTDGWLELDPQKVLSDDTHGFLLSGIVCVDLPEGMSMDCPYLPGPLYWLRLSVDRDFDGFAGLYGVHVNAVGVTRVRPPDPDDSGLPLPPGAINAPLNGIPGLLGVRQVAPTFDLRAADKREQVLIRGGERLRHKNRASTAWDYERLLLDAFPDLLKVQVFPHQADNDQPDAIAGRDRPGQVLVVVVPSPRPGAVSDPGEAPCFNAASLQRMTEHLSRLSAPGARVVVRNAAYERVQVRCWVRLAPGALPGTSLNDINQAVVDFLSPWSAAGRGPEFGWTLRAEDLENRLRLSANVEFVGALSLLHIAGNDRGFYRLEDSARGDEKQSGAWGTLVKPASPWGLLLPTRKHLITSVDDLGPAIPIPTGIDLLEIGNTFIISRQKP